jgi:type IV pilus assembly protein PilF
MKSVTMLTLIVCALVSAGCVTEGVVRSAPVSDEEAARANLALGISYLQEERPDFAIDALERALAAQPRLVDAHSSIAVAYDLTGDTDLAEQHHRRAAQLAPGDSNVQNRYAVFLCRQNRWNDALPYFRRAIEAAGNVELVRANYLINAATCARTGGDLAAAETNFRAVLDLDSSNADALRGMMDIAVRTENYFSGRAFWQRLERTGSVEANDLLLCYMIESRLGDNSAARDCGDRLRREFPGTPAVRQLRDLERDGN